MSKKQHKLVPESITIQDYRILKGAIHSPFEFDIDMVENHTFDVDLNLGFQPEDKLVKAEFSVTVSTESEDKNTEEADGEFLFAYIYHVDNMEVLLEHGDGDQLVVDYALLNAIASITYSTSRGILMTRFQGTGLSNFILPVIDPDELLD